MAEYAFLVDSTKCTGCRACQVTCKQWNNLPAEDTTFFGGQEYTNPKELSAITFNHVKFSAVDRSDPEHPVWSMVHTKCYHCRDANCLIGCPKGAISKENGWTVIDHNKCIGCGACEMYCVYNVPHVLEKYRVKQYGTNVPLARDKSYKCHGCTSPARDVPACAKVCPMGALTWGKRSQMVKNATARLEVVKKKFPKAAVYGLKEFGGLNVLTILKDAPEAFGLPTDVKPIDPVVIKQRKELFNLLCFLTPPVPALRRAAYKLADKIS